MYRFDDGKHRPLHRGGTRQTGAVSNDHGVDAKPPWRGEFQPPIHREYLPEITLIGGVCKFHLPRALPTPDTGKQGIIIGPITLDAAHVDMRAKNNGCPDAGRIEQCDVVPGRQNPRQEIADERPTLAIADLEEPVSALCRLSEQVFHLSCCSEFRGHFSASVLSEHAPPQKSLGIVALRIREAREAAGISQRQLGIVAGLDVTVASPRINQYEQGRHMPNQQMLERLGHILDRPLPWFYAVDEELATLLLAWHQATPATRRRLLKVTTGQ